MSDLAISDLHNEEAPQASTSVAVFGGFGGGSLAEASLSALHAGLPFADLTPVDASSLKGSRRAGKRVLENSDAIVVINPDISSADRKLRRLAALTIRARLAGKPISLVGLSAFELRSPLARFLAKIVVTHSDLVLLRDEASADVLARIGIEPPFRIGADVAWAQFDDLYAAKTPADQVVVALDGVIDIRDGVSTEETLIRALEPVAATGLEVKLHAGQGGTAGASSELAHKIAGRLGDNVAVIKAPTSMRDARDLYSGSRVVLALQAHALMAAAGGGSRALSLLDDPRARRLSSTLDYPVLSASTSPDVLALALLHEADRTPTNAASVRTQIDRAKASIELVRFLVSGGTHPASSETDPLPLYPNPWRA